MTEIEILFEEKEIVVIHGSTTALLIFALNECYMVLEWWQAGCNTY
jgi:hypothetical protein